MTYGQLRRLVLTNADTMLNMLTQRQFVDPHRPVSAVLMQVLTELNAPPEARLATLNRLGLEPTIKIGRLKRCQLTQLARVLFRETRIAGDRT